MGMGIGRLSVRGAPQRLCLPSVDSVWCDAFDAGPSIVPGSQRDTPTLDRRGPTTCGKFSESDHFWPNPTDPCRLPAPAANAKATREPDEVWDRERLGASATSPANSGYGNGFLRRRFAPPRQAPGRRLPLPRASRQERRAQRRHHLHESPGGRTTELTSSPSLFVSAATAPPIHTHLPFFCSVSFCCRRRRPIVTLGAVAEVGTGGPAAGGECGVVGDWYLHQPNNAWNFVLVSVGMVAN